MAGYPTRIEFIRKNEKPIENIFDIYSIQSGQDYVIILMKGQIKPLCNNVTLDYMKSKLPPCLFFCCGQSGIVNMKRVKSCCFAGRRIKLEMKKHTRNEKPDPVYVSRLRVEMFLALLTLYPYIKRGKGI